MHKDPSTISKEVKRYSKTVPAKYSYKCNLCKHYKDCDLRNKELKCPRYSIHHSFYCKKCCRRTVIDYCPYFLPYKCNKIYKPPYVCNYCEDYKSCPLSEDIKSHQSAYRHKAIIFRAEFSRLSLSIFILSLNSIPSLSLTALKIGQKRTKSEKPSL